MVIENTTTIAKLVFEEEFKFLDSDIHTYHYNNAQDYLNFKKTAHPEANYEVLMDTKRLVVYKETYASGDAQYEAIHTITII